MTEHIRQFHDIGHQLTLSIQYYVCYQRKRSPYIRDQLIVFDACDRSTVIDIFYWPIVVNTCGRRLLTIDLDWHVWLTFCDQHLWSTLVNGSCLWHLYTTLVIDLSWLTLVFDTCDQSLVIVTCEWSIVVDNCDRSLVIDTCGRRSRSIDSDRNLWLTDYRRHFC